MIIKSLLEDVGVLAIALALGATLGGVHGYDLGVAHDAKRVADANGAAAAAAANVKTLAGRLADIKAQLDAQAAALAAAALRAQTALAQRDAAQAARAKAESETIQTDRKIADETPNGAELARMPVYPALARRLFGSAGQGADSGARPAGH